MPRPEYELHKAREKADALAAINVELLAKLEHGRAARALAALEGLPHSATLAYNRVSGVWVLSGAPGRRVGRTAVGALLGDNE